MNNVLNELRKVKVFYLATTDGNKPKVRPFSIVTEFEGKIYIYCGKQKEVYKQLKNNPYIEICECMMEVVGLEFQPKRLRMIE